MERCLTLTTGVAILIGISLVVALSTVLIKRNQQQIPGKHNHHQITNGFTFLFSPHSNPCRRGGSNRHQKPILNRRLSIRNSQRRGILVSITRLHPHSISSLRENGHNSGTLRRLLSVRLRKLRQADQHP